MFTDSSIVLPGQPLAPISSYSPGSGVHVFNNHITSSLVGQVIITQPPESAGAATAAIVTAASAANSKAKIQQSLLPTLSVIRPKVSANSNNKKPNVNSLSSASDIDNSLEADATLLPDVGSEVLARVNRINQRQATVGVFVVGGKICGDEFQGVIRAQDVRATEVDKVKIFTSFRPGDIVRAKVISLGDQSNYYLSTASNNLGVVMASSEAGDSMYPVSWNEMKSTRTGLVENRKVAKPF